MNNTAQSVKDKLRNIAREKNIDFNCVMRFYMYDRFVERLSKIFLKCKCVEFQSAKIAL